LNPTRAQIGQARVKGIIAGLGTAITVYSMIHSPAGKAAMAAGKKALESSSLRRKALKTAAKRSGQLTLF